MINQFNDFINKNKLMEIKRGGSRYSWTNKQSCPVMVELDRILVTTDWESKFPLCTAHNIIRVGSDHSPLVLDSGEKNRTNPRRFYFENRWFCQEDFRDLVKQRWGDISSKMSDSIYYVDRWNGGWLL